MKKIFILSTLLAIMFFAFSCNNSAPKPENSEIPVIETAHIYYTCTMHPEIHSHEPGLCPLCGMDLVIANNAVTDSTIIN